MNKNMQQMRLGQTSENPPIICNDTDGLSDSQHIIKKEPRNSNWNLNHVIWETFQDKNYFIWSKPAQVRLLKQQGGAVERISGVKQPLKGWQPQWLSSVVITAA